MTKAPQPWTKRAASPAAAAVAAAMLHAGVPAAMTIFWGSPVFASPAEQAADPQRFGFGQPMRVDEGERIDSIVTIGGDLTVLGAVENDAVVIGGTLELGPEASIGGDAIAVGGTIVAPESARIVGERTEVSGAFDGDRDWGGPLATSLATFVQVFAAFLISALLLVFAPTRVQGVAEQIRATPGRAVVFGFAILLLFLPLLGALTISIVGIPLIPVAVMLLAAILVFGMTGLALALGQAILRVVSRSTPGPRLGDREGRSSWGAMALGYVVIGLFAWIPYVGAMLIPLAALFAGGAVLARWLSCSPRGRRSASAETFVPQ